MKIMENRRKGRWKIKVACQEAIAENRGTIDKKAYEDQFVAFCQFIFCQFIFRALSLFFLSQTILDIEFSWSTLELDEGKEKKERGSEDQVRKNRLKQLQWDYL